MDAILVTDVVAAHETVAATIDRFGIDRVPLPELLRAQVRDLPRGSAMNAVSDVRWLAVQTHSRAEEKAAAHVTRQGFEVYLPRYLRRKCHARRVTFVPAALFPRYLFVAVDMVMQRWRAIHSTVGVTWQRM